MTFRKRKGTSNRYTDMDSFGNYKATLERFIEETRDRSMFTQTDVQDMLLDLYNALTADQITDTEDVLLNVT